MKTKGFAVIGAIVVIAVVCCAYEFWRALENRTNVLKFGPMFFGIYPGGLAFASPQSLPHNSDGV